jgi:transposase-like protein
MSVCWTAILSSAPNRGRRPVLNADKRALAVRLYNERQTPISRICAMMGISKPTLYSYLRAANSVTEGPPAR